MFNFKFNVMRKTFTQKMALVAVNVLFAVNSMNAADPVKTDFTDLINNPSFEHYADDEKTPLDVTSTTDPNLISGALRGTPPGWLDTGVTPPATGNLSYGINRNAVNKAGFNACWAAPTPFPEPFALYQEIQGLPAGQYIFSCRMVVFKPRLTSQRFFVQTKNGENVTNNIVQYFGRETDYGLNLTEGETNTYAGWDFTDAVTDQESRLKPMSITVTVAEGETVVLGVKSGDMKATGDHTETQEGFFKVDDFRITKVVEPDPNDYTSSITNNSFEFVLIDNAPVLLKTHNIAAYSATDPQRGVPYGWSDIVVDDNPVGNSYGVNTDANNIEGAKQMWVMRTPFMTDYTLYQDVTGLPAGRYQVSCDMFVENGRLTTQRLFAKNNVQYYGSDYQYLLNIAENENVTYAGWETSANSYQSGLFLLPLSVEVDVNENEPLRIGVKSGNMKADGLPGTGSEGWFKLDNFRLKRIADLSGFDKLQVSNITVSGQKGEFTVFNKTDKELTIQVVSVAGQILKTVRTQDALSQVSVPQGMYILKLSYDGRTETTKVLVK